jgi:excisionase family DNA binding protein
MGTVETSDDVRLLTVDEARVLLRCSRASIYRRVHDGTLPAMRVGESGPLRFEPSAVYRVLRPVRHDHEENP